MSELVAVVKLGGSTVAVLPEQWWDDFAVLARQRQVIVVHGWSRPLLHWQAERGIRAEFRTNQNGHRSRVTDQSVIADIRHVAAEQRELMSRALTSRGVLVRGIVAAEAGLITAEVRRQRWWFNGELVAADNLVGQVRSTDSAAVAAVLADGAALLATPLAASPDHPYVNIDADHAAAALAGAAGARDLVMVTDVPGVLIDGSVVPVLHGSPAAGERAQITGGMSKKVRAATAALSAGVKRVVIGSGYVSDLLAGRAGTRVAAT